jgi:hypothetical protein
LAHIHEDAFKEANAKENYQTSMADGAEPGNAKTPEVGSGLAFFDHD